MFRKSQDKNRLLIDDIKSIDIFEEFYDLIKKSVYKRILFLNILSFLYYGICALAFWYVYKSNYKRVFIAIGIIGILLLIIYKFSYNIHSKRISSNYYDSLKSILKGERFTNSETISNLIDEAIFFRDQTLGFKDSLIETFKRMFGVVSYLLSIFLGAKVKLRHDDSIYTFIGLSLLVLLISYPIIYSSVIFKRKNFNNLSRKTFSYDLYLGYLYKYRMELSIEENKLGKVDIDSRHNNCIEEYEEIEDNELTRNTVRIEDPKDIRLQKNGKESIISFVAGVTIIVCTFLSIKKHKND